MADLTIAARTVGTARVLDITGDLNLYNAPRLRALLDKAVGYGQGCLVINLASVNYIDSTGLHVLIVVWKKVRDAGGSLTFICPSDAIYHVLSMTGLARVFTVHRDEAEALHSFS